ncbi:hypothetical protein GCM10029976_090710 [Kribbella albertanoniae]|uniref:DUF3846 domain-containing protein n=1 Tax=Kribbella albertanoniae TaxID=1266829 RepID=A0A4R4PJA5_9ACTN|nr:hypothetical protein [Kribbella albertanoniae]TDC22141.1 hypothetical protein E1261_31625 [Kribbella albertanoniae]
MTGKVRIAVVPAVEDEPVEVRWIDRERDIEESYRFVGSITIQRIWQAEDAPRSCGRWWGYTDEDSKMKQSPVNRRATGVAEMLGWTRWPGDFLAGSVVFIGRDGELRTDVPDILLTVLAEMGSAIREFDQDDQEVSQSG